MGPFLLLTALVLTETPLEQATRECERDLKACARKKQLQAEEDARQEAASEARAALQEKEEREALAKEQAEEESEQAVIQARQKRCGKDFNRVRVGMSFKRVRDCAGPFEMVGQDEHGTIYRAAGGSVRVEGGKVTRWAATR